MNRSKDLFRYSLLALAASTLMACNDNTNAPLTPSPAPAPAPVPAPPAPTPPAPTPPAITPDTYVLTNTNKLIGFVATAPNTTNSVTIAVPATETLLGGDFRPADRAFYIVTRVNADNSLKAYTVNTSTGALGTAIPLLSNGTGGTAGAAITLTGTKVGVDFNPVANALRIVDNTGVNLRTTLAAGNNTFVDAPVAPGFTENAYTNTFNTTCQTDLYEIVTTAATGATNNGNQLLIAAVPNGVATNTAAGGRFVRNLGVIADANAGFDIRTTATDNIFTLALKVGGTYGLYTLNPANNDAPTNLGNIGGLGTDNVLGLVTTLPATDPANAVGNMLAITGGTTNNVVSFNRPPQGSGARLCSTAAITGITAGDVIVGADTRPNGGGFTVLAKNGTAGVLYTVSSAGAATARLPLTGGTLTGTDFAVDFNPVPDRLRVIGDDGQNLRIDTTAGTITTDTALTTAGGTTARTGITAAGYTNSLFGGNAGSLFTTLFAIDSTANSLVRIGANPANAVANDPGNPNSGVVNEVGPLGVDVGSVNAFDINGGSGQALLAATVGTTTTLYTVNLATGAAAAAGNFTTPILALGTRGAQTATVFGVTTSNKLVSFLPSTPNTVSALGTISVPAGEDVIDLDFRPSVGPRAGALVALTSAGKLYTVNTGDATATLLSTITGATVPPTEQVALDFNPLPDRLRSITDVTNQNLRTNVDTGVAATDTAASVAGIFGAGYTNNVSSAANTTLYVLRSTGTADEFGRVGGDPGSGAATDPTNPNSGVYTSIGALGFDTSNLGDLDFAGGQNGFALAALQPAAGGFSGLYRIPVATGVATKVNAAAAGDVTTVGSEALRGIAIQVR